jgi:hypothetical protein
VCWDSNDRIDSLSFWIEADEHEPAGTQFVAKAVGKVVSPILVQTLHEGNRPLMDDIIRVLDGGSVFYGNNQVSGLDFKDRREILLHALQHCEEESKGVLPQITRTCLAASKLAMEYINVDDANLQMDSSDILQRIGKGIIEFTVPDLLWRIDQKELVDGEPYQFVLEDRWKILDQHERLSVHFALGTGNSKFPLFKDAKDGWENDRENAHQKLSHSIRLAYHVSQSRNATEGKHSVNVYGPFSLAVCCVLANSIHDAPLVKIHNWPHAKTHAEVEQIARATELSYTCLRDTLKELNADEEKPLTTFKTYFAENCSQVICALEPNVALNAFTAILTVPQICTIFMDNRKEKNLQSTCQIAANFMRGESFSADDILDNYQYEVKTDQEAFELVETICGAMQDDNEQVDANIV